MKITTIGIDLAKNVFQVQFVKPYVKTNKNDRNDAEATCICARC